MTKRLYVLCAVFATVIALAAGVHLFGQQSADQAATRPDRLMLYGDVGTCNEGETWYNALTHFGKRCGTGGNVGWAIPAVAATTANSGSQYSIGSNGLPALLALEGDPNLTANTVTGLSAMRVCHVTYKFATDGGATPIVPAGNCIIPINAVITNAGVQATTSVTPTTATVAVGCVGGTACGASSLMAATLGSLLTAGTFGQSIPVPQTASSWVKTSAATGITLTIASGPLTAGIVELYVFYYASSS